MNIEEQEKCRDLLNNWITEARNIKDFNNQPTYGGRLDNGNSGEYTKLTKKYQNLIEKRLGKKIWSK